jgi:hypothetical protein
VRGRQKTGVQELLKGTMAFLFVEGDSFASVRRRIRFC